MDIVVNNSNQIEFSELSSGQVFNYKNKYFMKTCRIQM